MVFFEPFSKDISGNKEMSGNKDVSGNTDISGNVSETKDISGNDQTQIVDLMKKIFEESHIYLLFGFFLIYLVVFVVFGMYIPYNSWDNNSTERHMSRIFDYVVLFFCLLYIVYLYFSASEYTKTHLVESFVHWCFEFYDDPFALFGTMLFMVTFYAIGYILRITLSGPNSPWSVSLIIQKGWFLLATLIVHNILKYVFGVDLMEYFKDPKLNEILGVEKKAEEVAKLIIPEQKPEVFNISNNLYTYDDAQAICKAFDSRLANYDEMENAYQDGAEWCNYGWSEGQMAFFPTQKSTWSDLQKTTDKKNSCGRPGVNGGFFANPYIKFGVNCFGKKPKATKSDLDGLESKKLAPVPKSEADMKLDEKVEYWKTHAAELLKLNSFNQKAWSQF